MFISFPPNSTEFVKLLIMLNNGPLIFAYLFSVLIYLFLCLAHCKLN
jgi:hypothetical protein